MTESELLAVENDTGQFVRKITVEWGPAPKGCRIIISEAA